LRPGALGRDVAGLAAREHDLIVVGGGVHGIMVSLEAARRGLRPLLLERADFAGATSHNSLRILHGGLRHLQRLDLAGARESAREQAFWLDHFPELVQPLACLLPLDGAGPRRPAVLRLALALNALLARSAGGGRLPSGRVLDPAAARTLCPLLETRGLAGAALWYDAFAPAMPRLLIEALRWAVSLGAGALNRVEAGGPLPGAGGRLAGVRAEDRVAGGAVDFRAPVVINAAGPGARAFATACGAAAPPPATPVLAWNVAFDRPPPSEHALAVRARRPGAQTWFLVPWHGRLLAGTGYAPWPAATPAPAGLPGPLLEGFLGALEEALPGLAPARSEVLRTFTGLLPAARADGAWPAERPVVLDHRRRGGPAGLFSLGGVKLTTARALAARVLGLAFPDARPRPATDARIPGPAPAEPPLAGADDAAWEAVLAAAAAEEAVVHLDDLLLRRTRLGDDPGRARALAPLACRLLGWEGERAAEESARLGRILDALAPGPASAGHPA